MTMDIQNITVEMAAPAASFFGDRLDDTFSQTFPSEAIESYRISHTADELRERADEDGHVAIASVDEDDIKGVLFGNPPNGGVAHIAWVVVHPDARGEGIGRELLEAGFERYRDMGVHKVALYTETIEARGFYEAVGMVLEGEHPNHWWGVDHYCLAKELNE